MFQTKVVDKIKTHTLHVPQRFFDNRAVYEMWEKNIVELGWPHITI